MKEQLKKKGLELEEYVREIGKIKKIEDETLNHNINRNELLQKQRPRLMELMEHSKKADLQTMKSYRNDVIKLQADVNRCASNYGECLSL